VQLARHHFGAHVTGVCSTAGLDLVRSLGADQVVDYTKEDFTRSGESYACILDVLAKSSFARCKASLAPGGRYLLASFKGKQLAQMLWTWLTRADVRVTCALAPGSAEALRTVKGLIEESKLKPVVGRRFRLEQLAEAHRWAEGGPKRGHVAISVA